MNDTIELFDRKGRSTIIDVSDLPLISERTISVRWNIPMVNFPRNKAGVKLATLIMNPPKGMCVDHIDGNPCNNTRKNLRICTQKDNCANRAKNKKFKHSKYKGVIFDKKSWRSKCKKDGKENCVGGFKTERLAAIAYNILSFRAFGEFSRQNQIENITQEEIDFCTNWIDGCKRRPNSSSKYKGVYLIKGKNKFGAYIHTNRIMRNLGSFSTENEAAIARNNFITQNSLNHPLNKIV